MSPIAVLKHLTRYFDGDDKRAFHFMRCFSPVVLSIPPMEVIERLHRNVQAAKRIIQREGSAQAVCDFYGVTHRQCREATRTKYARSIAG